MTANPICQSAIFPTASGARVEILSSDGDNYRVRYVETGAIRNVPKEAVRS